MDSKELRQFVTTVECNSISKAAKRLFISSQGLGKNIRKLEGEFGMKLFERTSNGVTPTPAGRVLYEHAQKLLNDFEDTRNCMKEGMRGQTVTHTAFTYGALTYLGFSMLETFRSVHPDIVVDLQEAPDAQIDTILRAGEADTGIIAGPVDTSTYEARYLGSTRHVAVVNRDHPLARKDRIEYADLDNQSVIMVNKEFRPYQNVQNRLMKAGVMPQRVLGISEIRKIPQFVERSTSIGISVAFEMLDDPYPGTVVVPFADETLTWDLFLVYPTSHVLSESTLTLCRFIIDWAESGKAEFAQT